MKTCLLVTSVALLALGALLAAGCGGSGDSDKAGIEDALASYLSALATGDGQAACDQLTGTQARALYAEAVTFLPELHAESCADALGALGGSLGGPEREALEHAEVDEVEIEGDTATAAVSGGATVAHLTKKGNRWFISNGLALSP